MRKSGRDWTKIKVFISKSIVTGKLEKIQHCDRFSLNSSANCLNFRMERCTLHYQKFKLICTTQKKTSTSSYLYGELSLCSVLSVILVMYRHNFILIFINNWLTNVWFDRGLAHRRLVLLSCSCQLSRTKRLSAKPWSNQTCQHYRMTDDLLRTLKIKKLTNNTFNY